MRSIVRHASVLAAILLVLLGGCSRDTDSPTGPESPPALEVTPAPTLSFIQVSAGYSHTCGITLDNLAYCWGYNFFGAVGDGSQTGRLKPVRVATTLRFQSISAGTDYTCGVTLSYKAYCWGDGTYGTLGDGTTTDVRLTPVRAGSALHFRQVVAGNQSTCGVTTEYRAYCWGTNLYGVIGDGTQLQRLSPVPVAGGLRFQQVTVALGHACGITLQNIAYCWGNNSFGTLGSGPPQDKKLTPVRVAGGLRFRQVTAGFDHTCGVTTDSRAYCWGFNNFGEIGDGTSLNTRLTPLRVAGGLLFHGVGALGHFHTCGRTLDNKVYCWGTNADGLLGIGTTTGPETGPLGPFSSRPVAVIGGLQFIQISARFQHTCGVTEDNKAYCWGSNVAGQLGDGTLNASTKPVAVVGVQ